MWCVFIMLCDYFTLHFTLNMLMYFPGMCCIVNRGYVILCLVSLRETIHFVPPGPRAEKLFGYMVKREHSMLYLASCFAFFSLSNHNM